LRIAVEGLAALGVGEQDTVSVALEVEQDRVEAGEGWGEGGLHQQPGTCAEAQAPELRRGDVDQPCHRDLGAGADLQGNFLCG